MTFSEYMEKVQNLNQDNRNESDIETASESEASVSSNVL